MNKKIVGSMVVLSSLSVAALLSTKASAEENNVIQGIERKIPEVKVPTNNFLEKPLFKKERTSVTVTNTAALEAALKDINITDIYLDADLSLTAHILSTGMEKNIYGQGHTLNANKKYIKLMNNASVGSIHDLVIEDTDIYGIFWSDAQGISVTYDNVTHEGQQLTYLPYGTLNLSGKVTSHCTTEEVFQGLNLNVLDNAKVSLTSLAAGIPALSMLYANGSLTIGNNAELTVNSNAISISGGTDFKLINNGKMDITSNQNQAIHLAAGSTMDFQSGSSLKAYAGDKVEEAVEATNGSIAVRSGATFEVEGNGIQGTIITGNQLIFEEGSNFSITNHNGTGAVFGAYAQSTLVHILSNKGIETWDRGLVAATNPTMYYAGSLNTYFRLTGYTNAVQQSILSSNSSDFSLYYKTGNVGKITGGSFVTSAKDYTLTANEYTEGEDTLSGTYGADVASVHLFVNGTDMGEATLNNDGTYTFTGLAGEIHVGDVVYVSALDGKGAEQNRATVTINEAKDYALNANDYKLGEASLTGTYGADVDAVHLFVNGEDVSTAALDGGNFTFINVASKITEGADVRVVAYNGAQKVNEVTVTINVLDYALEVDAYTMGDTKIYGTAGADIASVELWVKGEKAQTVAVVNGEYQFTNVNQIDFEATDTLEVVGLDQDQNEVARIPVRIHPVDYDLTITDYNEGEQVVHVYGTYGDDIVEIYLEVAGEQRAKAVLNAQQHQYTFDDVGSAFTNKEKPDIVGYDKRGHKVASKPLEKPSTMRN